MTNRPPTTELQKGHPVRQSEHYFNPAYYSEKFIMKNQTENSTEALKANIEHDVHAAKEEITAAAKAQAETGKEQAANKLNDLSEAIDQVADSISEKDKLGLASYVRST